jgi:hypothetical protein
MERQRVRGHRVLPRQLRADLVAAGARRAQERGHAERGLPARPPPRPIARGLEDVAVFGFCSCARRTDPRRPRLLAARSESAGWITVVSRSVPVLVGQTSSRPRFPMLRALPTLLMLLFSAIACEQSRPQPMPKKEASSTANLVEQLPKLASNAPEDRIVRDHDPGQDPEIQRLIAEATSKLDAVRSRFIAGLPTGHHLFVTTILRSGDAAEQVFVAVRDWSNLDMVEGLLASPPHSVKYRAGDVLQIPRTEVIDWTIARPDGSEEGNLLGKYLDSLQARQSSGPDHR